MKALKEYIFEYSTPDKVDLNRAKNIELTFDMDGAFPFLINIENGAVIFGDMRSIHGDMFTYMDHEYFDRMELPYDADIWSMRYIDAYSCCDKKSENAHKAYDTWKNSMIKKYPYLYDKNGNLKYMTGRLWDVAAAISDKNKCANSYKSIVIAWWGEVDINKYVDLSKYVIKEAESEGIIGNIVPVSECNLFGVDNNGKVVNLNKIKNVSKQTKISKEQQQIAKAIHLAGQKEKEDFYKEFKKHRDERNQKNLYNHTRSKTEAEYRSIKYQESLEQ